MPGGGGPVQQNVIVPGGMGCGKIILWILGISAVLFVLLMATCGLATFGITSGLGSVHDDQQRLSVESITGSMRTQLRAIYSKTGKAPTEEEYAPILAKEKEDRAESRASGSDIKDIEYRTLDGTPLRGEITITMAKKAEGVLVVTFDFETGTSETVWSGVE